jgi:hypothetical protein
VGRKEGDWGDIFCPAVDGSFQQLTVFSSAVGGIFQQLTAVFGSWRARVENF